MLVWLEADQIIREGTGGARGLGKAVASALMLMGPFVIAFPTVILSANFHEIHSQLLDAD